MSPRRAHRRARRRSSTRSVVLIVAASIVVLLIIGGLTQVSRQSSGYDRNSNRTLAALGSVVVDQSNVTAGQVRTLVANLPSQSRQVLQSQLDSAVAQTANESEEAAEAAGVTASQRGAGQFATVFAQRAQSIEELRAAVDGFLGLQRVPAAGSASAATVSVVSSAPSLSPAQASNRIAAAGALLARSDSLYRSLRRSLAAASGHGQLPVSVWVTDPQDWQAGTVAANVDLMATSPTLAVTHNLVLRTIRLSPPALPTPQGTASDVAVISPVTEFGVSVVVANEGSVDEPRAVVHVSLQNQKTSVTTIRTESMPVALGATVALPEANFGVTPGTTYLLNISLSLPSGQTSTLGTATQEPVQIAPAT